MIFVLVYLLKIVFYSDLVVGWFKRNPNLTILALYDLSNSLYTNAVEVIKSIFVWNCYPTYSVMLDIKLVEYVIDTCYSELTVLIIYFNLFSVFVDNLNKSI